MTNQKKKHAGFYRITLNLIIFLIVTVLALFYILKDDPKAAFDTLATVDFFPFLIAILVVIVMALLDGLGITLLTKHYKNDYKFSQGVMNSIIGNFIGCFYKTGASFIQAYTFTKQGIKGTNVASILTMNFLIYQFAITIYSGVMIFIGYPYVKDIPIELLGNIKIFPLSLIGFGINILFLFLILLLAYWRQLHRLVLSTGINILSKLHIIKDPEYKRKKWTLQLATYRIELKRLFYHYRLLIAVLFFQISKLLLLNTLPYLCFYSLRIDLSQLSYVACLSGSTYLNLISSYIIVGAPEIGFQTIFSYLLTPSLSTSATSYATASNILWRMLTFYLNLVVGGLCFFFYKGSPKRYELLGNPATIYDLEVLNLNASDDKDAKSFFNDKKSDEAPLLTQEEVQKSFMIIKKNMEEREEEVIEQDGPITLSLQKQTLAKAIKEAEELMAKNEIDPEIQQETMRDLNANKYHQEKKESRKNKRKQAKLYKKMMKEKKALEKMLPHGTKIDIDNEKGINYQGPMIYETRTLTTSDQDEKENNPLDDTENKE